MPKKKKKQVKTKKKKVIVIEAQKKYKLGKHQEIWAITKDCAYFQSKKYGKKLKNPDGLQCVSEKGMLRHLVFGENGYPSTTYEVSIKELRKLLTKAEQMQRYWQKVNKSRKKKGFDPICDSFIHLNPELGFWVQYDKKVAK